MAVKIRFARVGKKHAPIYRIVATDSRKKRDGMFLENLGTYDPKTKQLVQFHDDRVAYWVSVGAEVTDAVARLMKIRSKQAPKAVAEEKVEAAPKVVRKTVVKKETTKKAPAAKKTKTATK
ncbi:MAG TPA: 30S ribosomal protein S16 [Candidatus Saccharimonadales bacterium]|nr:30S ribosomal protein S16 [Candidatus Saccharimonadales bacterium]